VADVLGIKEFPKFISTALIQLGYNNDRTLGSAFESVESQEKLYASLNKQVKRKNCFVSLSYTNNIFSDIKNN
jgi:hypothetical protein